MRALYRLYMNLVKLSLASFALRFSYCPTAHFLRFSVPYYAHPNFVAGGRGSSTFTVASLAVSENRSLLLPSVSAASLLLYSSISFRSHPDASFCTASAQLPPFNWSSSKCHNQFSRRTGGSILARGTPAGARRPPASGVLVGWAPCAAPAELWPRGLCGPESAVGASQTRRK